MVSLLELAELLSDQQEEVPFSYRELELPLVLVQAKVVLEVLDLLVVWVLTSNFPFELTRAFLKDYYRDKQSSMIYKQLIANSLRQTMRAVPQAVIIVTCEFEGIKRGARRTAGSGGLSQKQLCQRGPACDGYDDAYRPPDDR